jgi:hypothetical protein
MYPWAGKVDFEVECTDSDGNVTTKKHPAEERHTDPWVYAVHFQPDPATTVVVKILVDGDVQLAEAVEIGVPVNQPHTRSFAPHVPRLVRAINTTPGTRQIRTTPTRVSTPSRCGLS